MNNFHFYNKNLKQFARHNRGNMNKAEACLWKYALKAKQMGYTFNRQRPVLNYIADFLCKELKLIIEVDGYSHSIDEVKENDIIRQRKLEEVGFTVVRFTNNDVLHEIKKVREVLINVINELEQKRKA